MDSNNGFRDGLVRVVALIGLLLVLLLGAWGAILLAINLPGIASNVGNSVVSLFNFSDSGGEDTADLDWVIVTLPGSTKSGAAMNVSWSLEDARNDYRYTVSYTCVSGLTIKAPQTDGSYQEVACDTPFNFVGAKTKMTLIPSVVGKNNVSTTIFVSATQGGDSAVAASGFAEMSVIPAPAPTTISNPPTNTGASTYVPSTYTQSLYGTADLKVTINSINRAVSPNVGNPYYPYNNYNNYNNYGYWNQQNRVIVTFTVENIGTNVAPAGWMFNANLPVGYPYSYNSETQQALRPGDKIVYTLGFNSAVGNQNCTQQYPNNNCPWYQEPYQPYPYQGICYRYDGYQNLPVACPNSINPNYDYYNYGAGNTYDNSYNYGIQYSQNSYYYQNRVTIVVDPRNWIADYNRGNNTAWINSPIY